VETWERRLRVARPPVFCRIADDRLIFDLRTLGPSDWPALEAALKSAASGAGP